MQQSHGLFAIAKLFVRIISTKITAQNVYILQVNAGSYTALGSVLLYASESLKDDRQDRLQFDQYSVNASERALVGHDSQQRYGD